MDKKNSGEQKSRTLDFSSPEFFLSVLDFSPSPLTVPGSPRMVQHRKSAIHGLPSLCACSESSLTNMIGFGLNLLCLQSHSKTECRWTRPEVAILGADQKERGLWGLEWLS